MPTSRPRVAAIGLNEDQLGSIGLLCGTLRTADSVGEYVKEFNWTETDIAIGVDLKSEEVGDDVHVVAITPRSWTYYSGTHLVGGWSGRSRRNVRDRVALTMNTDSSNTEREISVPEGCSEFYMDLAHDLRKRLRRSGEPPATLSVSGAVGKEKKHLVEHHLGPSRRCSMHPSLPTKRGRKTGRGTGRRPEDPLRCACPSPTGQPLRMVPGISLGYSPH